MATDADCKVRPTAVTGYWKDAGNVTGVLEVNGMVLDGIEPRVRGQADDGSDLIGRVVVAPLKQPSPAFQESVRTPQVHRSQAGLPVRGT